MTQLAGILFGWLFTVAVSWCSGKLLLLRIPARLYRAEQTVFAFVVGFACVSTVVWLLAAVHLIYWQTILSLGCLALLAAIRHRVWLPRGEPLPGSPIIWRFIFFAIYLPFAGLYLVYALAPESSPDGSLYHLGLVARYAREHGFPAITTSIYASLSQGMEMLFLNAFVFGRHTAAALVHYTWLLVLPWVIWNYGRRIRMPAAGVAGGILIFVTPISGIDGISAYNDIAVTTVAFSTFALVQIWAEQRDAALLVLIGLVAGFAFDLKYTAFVAVLYALGFVAYQCWRSREPLLRPVLRIAAVAGLLVLPTFVKNAVVVHNPVAPFLNRLFPNPYVHVSFEQAYWQRQRNYQVLQNPWEIPLEVTVNGDKLQGVLGPVFLLAPLALLSLRYAPGRQLLLAALVFALPYPTNIGTRFLLPSASFLGMALALCAGTSNIVPAALLLAHSFASWPVHVKAYCKPWAFRLQHFPLRAALRIEPADQYLSHQVVDYAAARAIDSKTPPGSRIFSFAGLPEAYCSREILVSFQAALNERLRDALFAGFDPFWQPTRAITFHTRPSRVRRLRLVQTASDRSERPEISEIEVFGPHGELLRGVGWHAHAKPFPWDADLMLDGNLATKWSAWQSMKPGMYVEVDFGADEVITSVRLRVPPDQGVMRWRLDAELPPGSWTVLSSDGEFSKWADRLDLRKAALDAFKQNGIRYIEVDSNDYAAADLRNNASTWGISVLWQDNNTTLYHIQ